MGKEAHGYLIRHAFQWDVYAGSALINLYSNCGKTEIAYWIFDQMPERNVDLWNAMIRACFHHGYTNDALKHLHKMQLAGVKPNSTTILSILPAFATWKLYKRVKRSKITYLEMGYGMHGYGEDALQLFNQMQEEGMKPDHATYVAVLFSCSHACLVDEGLQYFEYMKQVYHITPQMEHYESLLNARLIHDNLELGEYVAAQILEVEPKDAGNYVLLSNVYAAGGSWDDAVKMRMMMKDIGLKRMPGCS
eukprot:PITA_28090